MSDEDEAFDQNEDDEEEELEADGDDSDAPAEIEADADVDEDETVAAAPVGRAARGEIPEAHSVAARAALRNTLAADVEAFLARGGSIQKVADDHPSDPPKKPAGNYGRGSA
jgi:hypothetical protein